MRTKRGCCSSIGYLIVASVEFVVGFYLRVVGAFGASWAIFASLDITRTQFFGYDGREKLLDNPIYAKVAVLVSLTIGIAAFCIFVKEKYDLWKANQATPFDGEREPLVN